MVVVVVVVILEKTKKDLTSKEIAMLIFRLGWLNIWSPIKAEGCMWMNLSRREERQVCLRVHILTQHTYIHTYVHTYRSIPYDFFGLEKSSSRNFKCLRHLYTYIHTYIYAGIPNARGSKVQRDRRNLARISVSSQRD